MIIRLFPPPPSFSLLLSPPFYIFLFLFFFHRFPTTEKHEQKDGFRHGMNPYKLAREREREREAGRKTGEMLCHSRVKCTESKRWQRESHSVTVTLLLCYFVPHAARENFFLPFLPLFLQLFSSLTLFLSVFLSFSPYFSQNWKILSSHNVFFWWEMCLEWIQVFEKENRNLKKMPNFSFLISSFLTSGLEATITKKVGEKRGRDKIWGTKRLGKSERERERKLEGGH